jgi:D-ribose pyranose/furanose isomerase RbsD
MKPENNLRTLSLLVLFLCAAIACPAAQPLSEKLAQELPSLGHRNWIVVADAAYPLQTAPGIETITVEVDHLAAVAEVLRQLTRSRHVRPVLHTDAELAFVAEGHAPGITAFRADLARLLAGQQARVLPHEQIIAMLDDAGRSFKVLLIKTPLALPYTSVFFQLECGYWSEAAEAELRDAMRAAARP